MDFVNEISSKVLAFGDKMSSALGIFFIPTVLVAAILLLGFARYSYRLLRLVLPLSCVAIGAVLGVSYLTPWVTEHFSFLGDIANIDFIVGIVVAAVFVLLSFCSRPLTILVVGGTLGYLSIGRLAKDILLTVSYVRELAEQAGYFKASIVGILICILCMLVTAFILHKFFNSIYVVATTIIVSTATLALVAIFIFSASPMAPVIALGAAAIGFVYGSYCCHEQWYDVDFI